MTGKVGREGDDDGGGGGDNPCPTWVNVGGAGVVVAVEVRFVQRGDKWATWVSSQLATFGVPSRGTAGRLHRPQRHRPQPEWLFVQQFLQRSGNDLLAHGGVS